MYPFAPVGEDQSLTQLVEAERQPVYEVQIRQIEAIELTSNEFDARRLWCASTLRSSRRCRCPAIRSSRWPLPRS